jgi:heptosyltransferase-2
MDNLKRILVVLPSWVGDAVMATPALRALRKSFPDAHISYLLKPYVAGVVTGLPWHDSVIEYAGRRADGSRIGWLAPVREVAAGKFDAAVLLSNSFRSAATVWMAGVPRRVGYDRDGRGLMLTDRLVPYKEDGRFIPEPMVRYYLGLAKFLGAHLPDPRPELAVTAAERTAAAELLARKELKGGESYVVLNPGAAFGSAKMWGAEKFAAVADEIIRRGSDRPVILCGPKETAIGQAIRDAQKRPDGAVHLFGEKTDLGTVKAVVAGSRMLITNDSGPRHFGIAFDRPVVTIFGSSDPAWTECHHPKEIQVRARVHCSPCMLRTCPIDHRCMKRITPELVMQAADMLVERFCPPARATAV